MYTVLLVISLIAVLLGILFLYLHMGRYDFKFKGGPAMVMASGNRSQGTVPIFAAQKTLMQQLTILPRKWDCPPCAAGRGQVHVFGRPFAHEMRFMAEKWTSPQPPRERLLASEAERSEVVQLARAGQATPLHFPIPNP